MQIKSATTTVQNCVAGRRDAIAIPARSAIGTPISGCPSPAVGIASSPPPGYYYGPGPAYYGAPPPPPGCYWQQQRYWDGYAWNFRPVRVCY